ncbi:hypothetical protein [Pyrococcus sp. NA2]|uniref:hypothetical protein n=1 Tax=Pyrococcus sp. (strain NA2) TaxID=342949 RepID=UPI00064F02A7|nr:hypothetical protein [Pyrococcus sp. NA2]
MRDLLFWLAIIFIFASGYFDFKKRKVESTILAGLAGGFALAFALYYRAPLLLSFLVGFIATALFEWSRKR